MNAIHMIDLAAWLSGVGDFVFDAWGLDPVVHQASRKGHVEFTGLLVGSAGDTKVSLYSDARGGCPSLIHIMAEGKQALLDERNSIATLWEEDDDWHFHTIPLKVQFQSSLTNILADEILEKGRCRLISYLDSARLHKAVLKEFTRFYHQLTGSSGAVPIT